MSIEVLVVDDVLSAAQEYERLIRTTGLKVACTDDPEAAIELLSANPVKVVVLDQRMPKMAGTELFSRMKRVDRYLQAIMLTGEAKAGEAAEAFELGYSKYLDKKTSADRLAGEVVACYAMYVADMAVAEAEASKPMVLAVSRKWRPFRRHLISVSITNLSVLADDVVLPETWWTERQINVGSPQTVGTRTESIKSYELDEESESRLVSSLGSKLSTGIKNALVAEVSGSLEAEVSARLAQRYRRQVSVTETTETKYRLPEESADPDAVSIRARAYQRAPMYIRFRATLTRTCDYCGMSGYLVVTGHVHRGMDATRTIDYYSDGHQKEVDTGPA
jgi:CheY-like chemotaxis protein